MSRNNIENLLLKSLIEDLDTLNGYPNCTNFTEFEKTFNNSASSMKESLTDDSSNSDTSVIYPKSQTFFFTKKDIFNALATQKSSIFLQGTIREMSPFEISNFIKEIKGHFEQIMKDKNGNYLCSDLFKACTPSQRIEIIKEIFSKFDDLSIHDFATNPIQTLIELAQTQEEINLITSSLSTPTKIIKVSLNPNGSYVIQKIIMNIQEQKRQNFNMYLLSIIPLLSQDMYGVCTSKKFVCFTYTPFLIQGIIKVITNNFFAIAQNQYGNYLIQYILELWWNKIELCYIKKIIEKYFFQLSTNQYASHISESYIKMLSDNERQIFFSVLLQNGLYFTLLKDKYGVYVMNKLSNSIITKKGKL